MESLDVAEIRQLPELTGGEESPPGFADMVLTSLLAFDSAQLRAEHEPASSAVSWRLRLREEDLASKELEIALSPTLESFRSVLAHFGERYLGGQVHNGYALRLLRQNGRVHRCHFHLSDTSESGFWIRVSAARLP